MRAPRKLWRIGITALILSLIALGLNMVPATGGAQGGSQRELTILMGDFFFQVQGFVPNLPITLQVATPYKLTFKNVGNAVHRIKFGRGIDIEEGVPFDYVEQLFEDVNVRVRGATPAGNFKIDMQRFSELEVDPGVELIVEFTLPQSKQGEWEIGCFVTAHYEAGMFTKLIVQ